MAIRNTKLGGSDFGSEYLKPSDVNDTFDAVIAQLTNLKEHTDNTEYSEASATFADKFNFTFGKLNALLVGIIITCEMKVSVDTDEAYLRIKLSGTNLGTKYLNMADSVDFNNYRDTVTVYIGTNDATCLRTDSTSYRQMHVNLACALKLLDASTTLNVGLASASGGTAYLDTFKIQLVYQKEFTSE